MCWSKSQSSSDSGDLVRFMDGALITIAAIAFGLALAMGLTLLKVLGDERRRSEARVRLLSAAAAVAESPARVIHATPGPHAHSDRATPQNELFSSTSNFPSTWRKRVGLAAALAASLAAGSYLWLASDAAPRESTRAAEPSRPLELLVLNHVQDADGLTIRGLVQNPHSGVSVSKVTATAFVFGSDGSFLARGRAGLDSPTLRPGDRSPFVIKVPLVGSVARYRVGFRGADGSIMAHVDRRTDQHSARNGRIPGSLPWVD